jgi:hypothetical protein
MTGEYMHKLSRERDVMAAMMTSRSRCRKQEEALTLT